ncbi:FecR family protein [Devosia sp. YR412]|nr:FecR family protein [Devosia sp. YR412]
MAPVVSRIVSFIAGSPKHCDKQAMMKQFSRTVLFVLGLLLAVVPAFAEGEGTAVGVNPDASARLGSTDRVLQVGADVSVGEVIVTGAVGQVQIIFDDETRLVVGPRSALLIENYLLASNNRAQKLTINALGGSFRFITGKSPKPAYTINTPTASIAVRGTEFDLVVERSNTKVMLFDGALRVCNDANDCQELTSRCEVGLASNQRTLLYRRNDPSREPLSAEFRYARFQGALLQPFRVRNPGTCVESRTDANPGSSSPATQTTTTGTQTNGGSTTPTATTTPVVRPGGKN